ncbi:AMP-dependent synthetase/ligase [Patulibacter minatonensis]|uniref:AMP-dependent synthetase/ligase n=1 Tax=Patulibacter minatonensis TaxID=298163 RepID=UPI00056C48AA|nr:AMP-dependent synthetase/ligase [Patulibacter minatonensis]
MSGHDAITEVLGRPTVAAAFFAAADAYGDRPAVREHGADRALTFREWAAGASEVAAGLHAVGVRPGQPVALLLDNDADFPVCDMGSVVLGAVPFSLYNTAPVEQLLENIDNSEAPVVIAGARYASVARELVSLRPQVIGTLVIVPAEGVAVDPAGAVPGEVGLDELLRRGRAAGDFDARERATSVAEDDLVTLVYTSGTTGPPKGVQYRHSGVMFMMRAFRERLGLSPDGRVVPYLPMAHIAERLLGYYMGMAYGATQTLLPDLSRLPEALREVRPTRFFGVPRIYEKLLVAAEASAARAAGPDGVAALDALLDERMPRIAEDGPLEDPQAGVPEAARAAFDAAREETGLDRAEWLIMSGAPCPAPLLLRFHALGIRVNELYGGSENISATANPPEAMRLGTAGRAFPGVELRLADDGEVLLRGPNITPGYLKDPERTAEALDPEGWLHTGDVGVLDADGYLKIVDRKKDIIINSAGKNMSPTNIESAIKLAAPLVAQVVCVGDARPYNVALLVLDSDVLRTFADRNGLPGRTPAELADDPVVRAELERIVAAGNGRLSRVEQIKRFVVVPAEWTPGGEELTATGKLKRRSVTTLYADRIDALYAPAHTATGAAR